MTKVNLKARQAKYDATSAKQLAVAVKLIIIQIDEALDLIKAEAVTTR